MKAIFRGIKSQTSIKENITEEHFTPEDRNVAR